MKGFGYMSTTHKAVGLKSSDVEQMLAQGATAAMPSSATVQFEWPGGSRVL